MAECGCEPTDADTPQERRVLKIAFGLNAMMFIVGVSAGLVARSSGLIADGLDMLADATAYAIALAASGRSALFKASAARLSGALLLALGILVLADAGRRLFAGTPPEGAIMIVIASVALVVNATVLHLLSRQRSQEVHVRATVIFTRVDVIANIAVIASGVIVLVSGIRFVDLAVGAAIGVYVVKEAFEIIREARLALRKAFAETRIS
ncbi:cation diffusion facilitator family transporter [Sphingomonas sp. ASV193]|uniref:cation diffusion facilitator family transporter n=1 Tax=Sphingomonas sp. ASV193 TaxID=3144405 RepID=UPI0032E89CE6